MVGAVLYSLGLTWTAFLSNTFTLALSGGILMGVAIACTTYSVAYSVLGKMVPPERRAWAFGISAAAGSFGQFLLIPVGQWFISHNGWSFSLVGLALITATIAPLVWYFAKLGEEGKLPQLVSNVRQATAGEALRAALADRSFALLTLGYFVCGFQVVFIGAHFTPYLLDKGIEARVGVTALALIGLFNCFRTYLAGVVAGKIPKRFVLSFIYLMRSVVIALFLAMPISEWSGTRSPQRSAFCGYRRFRQPTPSLLKFTASAISACSAASCFSHIRSAAFWARGWVARFTTQRATTTRCGC